MDNHKVNEVHKTNESMENYLETILVLSKSRPVVRAVDIAEEMGFKKPSVSVALKKLKEIGDIEVTKEGFIYLTDKGKEVAYMIYERHVLLSNWLISLGVDQHVALDDACRIEHDLSIESFNAIKTFIKKNQADVYKETQQTLKASNIRKA